jgi:hypothetical protein
VVLLLYADGVSVAKRRDNSMFIISAQVVNLPPDKRRQLSNMLLLQIIPGPKTPSDLSDLLQPLVDELKTLYLDGVDIDVGEDEPINIKAMFISISADSRAHPKLTMMKQTPAIYPCHLCKLKVATTPLHEGCRRAACELHAGAHRSPSPSVCICVSGTRKSQEQEEGSNGNSMCEPPAGRPSSPGGRS